MLLQAVTILLLGHRIQIICALHSGSDAILQGQARHCLIKQQFCSLSDQAVVSWFAFFFSFLLYEDYGASTSEIQI